MSCDCEQQGEMTASRRRRRRCPSSPAAGPLDDDDLLCEILLRLSPQPSSLPRASAVCKRWRRLVTDPGFFRRFRLHHRRNPALLGFYDELQGLPFVPTLEAPNRVPPGRFSLPSGVGDRPLFLGCRHGLFLMFFWKPLQVLVWDPVTGDQHRFAVPAVFRTKKTPVSGAVHRAAGEAQHFQVVLAMTDVVDKRHERALACVYSSKTGLWGDLVSAPIPYQANGSSSSPTMVQMHDAVLAGDSLHWVLVGNFFGVLEFDLVKQRLAVTRVPMDMCGQGKYIKMMRAEGGGLGFLSVSSPENTAQSWKTDCDGVASCVLAKTIDLDKLLSLKEEGPLAILGFAEENNVAFLFTMIGLVMIHLDSLKFKKLSETMIFSYNHPFESVYAAGL